MRRVFVKDLRPDMKIARNIYSSDGRILLHAGICLTDSYISRLQEIGISSVYIKDNLFGEVEEIPDVISEQTRIETIKTVQDTFKNLEHKRKINVRMVQNIVNNLIDELLFNSHVLVNLSDIRCFDDYTFGHSVNVCVLAIMSGITLGYHNLKLKELGIGALLHDIGKTKIDKTILNKSGDLTKEEYEEIKKHSQHGFDILRKCEEISLLSSHIAFQHHERWDGKGYPRGLAGLDIHEYARIVAAADVYDALMADRPYRSAYSVTQSITILKRIAGIHLDPRCVTALVSNIAIYPLGSIVELNTGAIGIIVDINKDQPTRPVVRIVYSNYNRRLSSPHEVDLSKLSTISIRRSLTEKEITQLAQAEEVFTKTNIN